MTQLDGKKYWLYAVVDSETSYPYHTEVRPIITAVSRELFLREPRGKYNIETATFLLDDSDSPNPPANATGSFLDTSPVKIGTALPVFKV